MASSDRPRRLLVPIDCYSGMFGPPEDIKTGWGWESDVPAPAAPDHAAFNAAQHAILTRVLAAGTELLKKHGHS